MNREKLNESELKEILDIARQGETKFKEMSDRSTIIAEKWRAKTSKQFQQESELDNI